MKDVPFRQSLRLSSFYDNDVAISVLSHFEMSEFEREQNMVKYEIFCIKTLPPHNVRTQAEKNQHMYRMKVHKIK